MASSVPTLNFNQISSSSSSESSDPCTPRNDPSRLMEEVAIVDEIMQRHSPQSTPRRGTPPRTRRDNFYVKQLRSYRLRSASEGNDTIQTSEASSSTDIKVIRRSLESFSLNTRADSVLDVLKAKIVDHLLILSGCKSNIRVRLGYLPAESKSGFSINFEEEIQKKNDFNRVRGASFIFDAPVVASLSSETPDFDLKEFESTVFYDWKKGNLLRLYYYDMILADLKDLTFEDNASLLILRNYFALLNKHGMLIFKENIPDLKNQTCNLDVDCEKLKQLVRLSELNFIPQEHEKYFFKRVLQFIKAGFKIDESLVIFRLDSAYVFLLQKEPSKYCLEKSFPFMQTAIISALKIPQDIDYDALAVLGSSDADYVFDNISFSPSELEKRLEITRLKEFGFSSLKDFDEDNCFVTKTTSKAFNITSFLGFDICDWDVDIGQYFGYFSVLFTTITAELNQCFFKFNALMKVQGILIYEEIVTEDKIALAKRAAALEVENDSFIDMDIQLNTISREHKELFYLRMKKFKIAGFEIIKENIIKTPVGYIVSLRKIENAFEN